MSTSRRFSSPDRRRLLGAMALAGVLTGAAALGLTATAPKAEPGATPERTSETTPDAAGRLTVFAAASLKDVLEPAAAVWSAETGVDVALTFAGSSTLARQIEHGAPADLYISANADWMDHLAGMGLVETATRRDLAANALVFIAPADGAAAAPDVTPGSVTPVMVTPDFDLAARLGAEAPNAGRLAMALTEAVPAGIYGKAALARLGLWDGVADRLAEAQNVRAALALVARAEAPLGIVYASDAVAEPRVRVIARFPADSHPPIVYPGAVLPDGRVREARALLDWLASDAAWPFFARQRFLRPPAGRPDIAAAG